MKKFAYIIIIALLVTSTACGAKQKMEDKLAEKIIEQAVGADIDIDGDQVTIATEEGNVTLGSTTWPDSRLSSKIPELKEGKITSVMNSEAYLLVVIEEVSEKDFMDYYEKVKGEFNQESYETKSEDTVAYMGKSQDGISIMVSYSSSDSTVSISASMPEE